MTKKILEIAESVDPVAWGQQHPDDDAWCVKFAELIVRECGEFCGHDHEGVVAMFKHFGVEE